jgi:hypothetical protein
MAAPYRDLESAMARKPRRTCGEIGKRRYLSAAGLTALEIKPTRAGTLLLVNSSNGYG